MRHSDPRLTAQVYTDIGKLDIASFVEKLPDLLDCDFIALPIAIHKMTLIVKICV